MALLRILTAILCPKTTFNRAFNAKETFSNLDGQEYHSWRAVRRQKINDLTSDIYYIMLHLTIALVLGSEPQLLEFEIPANDQTAAVRPNYGIVYQIGLCCSWLWKMVVTSIAAFLYLAILQVSSLYRLHSFIIVNAILISILFVMIYLDNPKECLACLRL